LVKKKKKIFQPVEKFFFFLFSAQSANPEATALGAAYAAGFCVGLWDPQKLEQNVNVFYEPKISIEEKETRYQRWLAAVKRALDWKR
jgi:glycerol kinase